MVNLVYYLKNLLVFSIPLLHHYINLRLSIPFCLFSGDAYLSLGISLSKSIFSFSLSTVSELFCGEVLETIVTFLATFCLFFEMLFLKKF